MSTRFRDLKVSEYWNLAWPFALICCIGTVVHVIARRLVPEYLLPVMLADALIIAGVIGICLELFATRFLIERVATDVANKLAGRGLPSQLQSLIHEIVDTRIVRENYTKSYRLSEPDSDGYIRVEATVRYTARNYSGTAITYSPMIQEEIFYDPKFTYMEYETVPGSPQVLDEAKIAELTKEDPDTQVRTLAGPPVNLAPVAIDASACCDVILKYNLRMREEYSDVTNFGGATLGATVELDEIPSDFVFTSGGDSSIRHGTGSRTWHFDRPFINGQHMRVWWFRRKPDRTS